MAGSQLRHLVRDRNSLPLRSHCGGMQFYDTDFLIRTRILHEDEVDLYCYKNLFWLSDMQKQ